MRKSKALLIALFVSAFAMAAPQVASAGKKDKPRRLSKRKRRKLAKKLFRKAKRDFELGRFKKALKGFSSAYELVSHPGLLFNIGQCHRMMKNYKKAVFFYEGYLSAIPDAPNRAEVQKLIAEGKRRIKEAEARMSEAARRKHEEEKRRLELEKEKLRLKLKAQARAGVPKPFDPTLPRKKVRPSPFYKKWWFWTAIGAGVAAAVGTSLALVLTRKTETVLPSGSVGTIDWR